MRLALLTLAFLSLGGVGVAAAPEKITPKGVGGVKLGKTYKQLRDKHLVGRINHGCNLAGPNARGARLRAPLKGSVSFTMTKPRKVTDISISGGATARGVGIGGPHHKNKTKVPKAQAT